MWHEADLARAPVRDFPPRWASAWGDDQFGLWIDLIVAGVCQRLRWIEPGRFSMGSPDAERHVLKDNDIRQWADQNESPTHAVRISHGFWLADTPCTQALWLAVLGGDNPSEFNTGDDASLRPVEQVTWDRADQFVTALKARLPLVDAALPTEAQWEYACRAGATTAYSWGDSPRPDLANFDGHLKQTTFVKHYPPNPWGLHDMHGNVWEWCADSPRVYQDQPEGDPRGGTEGGFRVLRGGSWNHPAGSARSAYRVHAARGRDWRDNGLRFALMSASPGGGAGSR